MAHSSPRILVFDSGVGGFSIVQSIHQRLPEAAFLYVGDNARFPYGDLSEDEVIGRCVSLVRSALALHPADMVVIACNTASTVVLPALRALLKQPVIGVVPAIKPAAALSRNRCIGLLATPATVRRPYTEDLIHQFAADCHIVRVGSSELVGYAEAALARTPPPRDPELLARLMAPMREAGVDTVVLGCTHFPLIRAELQPLLPPSVQWVDSGEAIARRVQWLWERCQPVSRDNEQHGWFTAAAPAGLPHWLAERGLRLDGVHDHWTMHPRRSPLSLSP